MQAIDVTDDMPFAQSLLSLICNNSFERFAKHP